MNPFGSSSNQSQGSTLQVIGTPQWVAPNSTILLEFVNRSSNEIQNVASHLRWIEPDNIPGLDVENRIYQGVAL